MEFGETISRYMRAALTCMLEHILQTNKTSRHPPHHRHPAPPVRGGAYAPHRLMGQSRALHPRWHHAYRTALFVVQDG